MHWIALQTHADDAAPGADEGLLVDTAAAMGWWALQFTPRVAQVGQAVVFEVSGSERLYGGRQQLVERVIAGSLQLGPVRITQGTTSLVALALLQLQPDLEPQPQRGPASRQAPDRFPLATLPEARAHLPTLERLGCTVWGDVRALPRGGVVRRFGDALLDALDRAYGQKPEVYPWLALPDVFDMPLELFAQVEAAPALVFAARRLLSQLQVWLQARQRGIVALELSWQMDVRRNTATHGQLLVRTAQPTRDMQHMQRLLAENLARISLPAPVLYLRLRSVDTAPLSGASASLLPDDALVGDSLHQLLERLSARLGPQQVLRVRPHADHRPERMQVWVEASAEGLPAQTTSTPSKKRKPKPAPLHPPDGALHPTWLLATPLKLAVQGHRPLYQGRLALLAGPQRLEAAWWDVADVQLQSRKPGKPLATLRDYFLARSEQAGLLWIYRERVTAGELEIAAQDASVHRQETSQWYLHGVFG